MHSEVKQLRRTCFLSEWLVTFVLVSSSISLMSTNAFAQHTYYISKSTGSDSNTSAQAQSKSTPWAHLPGMPSCTSNCGSYSPVAGDQFILRGGDHWVVSDLPVNFNSNGNIGSSIYIGVDKTWFTGSSWARPILDCQSTNCNPGNGVIEIGGSYVTVDNIEIVGIRFTTASGTMKGVQTTSDHTLVENCYVHGWSHDPSFSSGNDSGRGFALASNASGGGTAGQGVVFHDNVIDGQDTTQDMMGGADDSETVYNNVFRYVYNCVRGIHTYVYNNLCEDIVIEGWANGDHANGISIFGPYSGTSVFAYNNVVRNTTSSAVGSETFWILSNGACAGCTSFIFNNVLYNNGRGIDTGDHPTVGSDGNFYIWNNTVEGGGNHCYGNGETGNSRPVYAGNNHCINVANVCDPNGTVCNAIGSSVNLNQTTPQADANTSPHFDQYTASETYAYSPVASTNSTVGAGTNFTSVTLPSAGGAVVCSGNLASSCSDAVYTEYDSTNHVPTFRTANSRPSSGAWDSGAYKFASGGCSVTPSSLGAYTSGQVISQSFTASACNASTFTISSGSLNGSGLSLSSSGLLSGTAVAGSFNFTVAYSTATDPISLTINQPPSGLRPAPVRA